MLTKLCLLSAAACQLTKDAGPCTDYTAVWYFEHISRTCRRFLYGGCGGNGNRFETHDDCQQTCLNAENIDREPVTTSPAQTHPWMEALKTTQETRIQSVGKN